MKKAVYRYDRKLRNEDLSGREVCWLKRTDKYKLCSMTEDGEIMIY